MNNERRKQQTKQNMMRLGALLMAALMLVGVVAGTVYYIVAL